ncbi:hypothetical protein BVRB_9g203020 [Beta vulgaris subsp. vulgaris]|nr:hypothetical protein BVRB_9g203020 [Beta vulgaris subsp. vulgaris]
MPPPRPPLVLVGVSVFSVPRKHLVQVLAGVCRRSSMCQVVGFVFLFFMFCCNTVVCWSSGFGIVTLDLRIRQWGVVYHSNSPQILVMASCVITPQKRILWEAPQLVLGHVKTSTSFEFQSGVTEIRLPSQKGRKSLSKVTSLLTESDESQEDHPGPWDFGTSGQDLLAVDRQSLYEDRSCVLQHAIPILKSKSTAITSQTKIMQEDQQYANR